MDAMTTIYEKRELFIEHQSQYYREDNMYDLIEQSDQTNAIRRGDYDDILI